MEETPAPPAPAASAEGPDAFVRRVRRRAIWRGALALAAPAALINEAVRWIAVGGALWVGRKVPLLDVGPLFLLVALAFLRRRWSLPATALYVDERLSFRDRLTSFLAFRSRGDIPADVRRAQEQETARALAGVRPSDVAPLGPWLAAGPLLLAVSVLYPLFVPVGETTTLQVAQRLAPTLFTTGGRQTPAPQDSPMGEDRKAPPRQDNPDAETTPQAARSGGPGAEDPERPAPAARTGAETGDGTQAAQRGSGGGLGPGKGETVVKEPAQIASQRVGTGLARVVDPVYTPGKVAAAPAPAPSGAFSFRLLPKQAHKGSGPGGTPGETAAPERVTVDLDAIPEEYRTVVRTYFELLARGSGERAADTLNP